MYLPTHKLIYLHVPKTGGNSVSQMLLDHADERLIKGGFRDGKHRFELKGRFAEEKHTTLAQYAHALGARDFASCRTAIAVRDPVDRAVSFYFSPHRWVRRTVLGWRQGDPIWEFDTFSRIVGEMKSIADFLRLPGGVATPDFILRHESLDADLRRMAEFCGISLPNPHLEKLNLSVGRPQMIEAVLADRRVQSRVRERFAEDYDLFGF